MRQLDIKEVQGIHLDILKFFDQICKANDLKYFLAYGTLLGAVRNNGFIAWDDDIDLFMLREDFNRLEEMMVALNTERYFFQSYKTDPKCIVPNVIRICVNNTLGWEPSMKKQDFHKGIYFDIFPLDASSNNRRFLIKKSKMTHFCQAVLYAKANNTVDFSGIKNALVTICKIVVPYSVISKLLVKWMHKNKDCDLEHVFSFAVQYPFEKNLFLKKDFNEAIFIKFEGIDAPCPQGYDRVLKTIYGNDYMIPRKTKNKLMPAFLLDE